MGAPPVPAGVAGAFDAFPAPVRSRLLRVRELIYATAAQTPGVGPLSEMLKWGEPAYLTQNSRSGSTIRLGLAKAPGCAVLFNCRTTLIADFKQRFPDTFAYEGDRAIVLGLSGALPTTPLAVCLALALTYHRR